MIIVPSNVGTVSKVTLKASANGTTFPSHEIGDTLFVAVMQGGLPSGFTQIKSFDATAGKTGSCGYRIATSTSLTVSTSSPYVITAVLSPCSFSTSTDISYLGTPGAFSFLEPSGGVSQSDLTLGVNAGDGNAAPTDTTGIWTTITPSLYYGQFGVWKPSPQQITGSWNGGNIPHNFPAEQHQSNYFTILFKPN